MCEAFNRNVQRSFLLAETCGFTSVSDTIRVPRADKNLILNFPQNRLLFVVILAVIVVVARHSGMSRTLGDRRQYLNNFQLLLFNFF